MLDLPHDLYRLSALALFLDFVWILNQKLHMCPCHLGILLCLLRQDKMHLDNPYRSNTLQTQEYAFQSTLFGFFGIKLETRLACKDTSFLSVPLSRLILLY